MAVTCTIPSRLIISNPIHRNKQILTLTSIDIESNLNLGNTLGGRGNTNKVEVTEELVVTNKLTFTLVDLDLNGGLTIGSSGEGLGLLGGDAIGRTRSEASVKKVK